MKQTQPLTPALSPGGERGQRLTCPECGKRIAKPRTLYKARMRWKLVAPAVLMLGVLAAGSMLLPITRRDGLGPTVVRILPTAVLVRLDDGTSHKSQLWPLIATFEGSVERELARRDGLGLINADDLRVWLEHSGAMDVPLKRSLASQTETDDPIPHFVLVPKVAGFTPFKSWEIELRFQAVCLPDDEANELFREELLNQLLADSGESWDKDTRTARYADALLTALRQERVVELHDADGHGRIGIIPVISGCHYVVDTERPFQIGVIATAQRDSTAEFVELVTRTITLQESDTE